MKDSQKPVDGALTVEELGRNGFKEVEVVEPIKLQDLKEPLVGILKNKTEGKSSPLYHIEIHDGSIQKIRGCTDLNRKMENVKLGDVIAIFFEGRKQLANGNSMFVCRVAVKRK